MQKAFFFSLIISIVLYACTAIDQSVNADGWKDAKQYLLKETNYDSLRLNFIIDEIEGIVQNEEELKLFRTYSFSDLIDLYDARYDSLNTLYTEINQTNEVLDGLLELDKAESVSLDANRGFIIFTLDMENIFNDSIEYMILTYQYIDDYGNLYFSETSKLSDQAAQNFNGKIQSVMTDVFNGQNEIIYLKTDLSAAEVLQKNYGIEEANESLEKEYLNEGLKVSISAIKFYNGNFIKRRSGDWKYYSNS